ncbi:uncharacterized protein BDW70DRAFT_146168, partial [Aspergillus foveolatus]|uniref:uncharacterized protein n=1 Tax=Aspergillus foveolatus TaxID=210207 RepID=UPI003CCDBAF0
TLSKTALATSMLPLPPPPTPVAHVLGQNTLGKNAHVREISCIAFFANSSFCIFLVIRPINLRLV